MRFVHSRVNFITCFGRINIFPGMNQLSDPEFAILENDKNFIEMVAVNRLIIGGTQETQTSQAVEKTIDQMARIAEIAKEISSLKPSSAKKNISEIIDIRILKALKEIDGRKGIQEALENRIKALDHQENTDLTPETIANIDDGSNFMEKIGTDSLDRSGTLIHTAIPALSVNNDS